MSRLQVAKFGGTSMGSPEALWNAAEILAREPASRLVVVSATAGTTNQLLSLAELSLQGEEEAAERLARQIRERHFALAEQAGASGKVNVNVPEFPALFAELEVLRGHLRDAQASGERRSPRLLDRVLSLGERLASALFAAVLRSRGREASVFDARGVIRTDGHFGRAEPDPVAIRALAGERLLPELDRHELLVTQGFLGSTASGETTTLGRGGSDYSAALLGEALDAECVRIWTDVPGVFTLDPAIAPQARLIPELSLAEAAELANFGARVLHPSTLLPAMRAGLPIYVGSTFRPGEGGTWVRARCDKAPLLRAIAVRKRQTLITVTSLRMLNAQGFLATIFRTLADHHLSVDLVTTSEISVALTIDSSSLGSGARPVAENQALLEDLRSFAEVTVEEGLTLVALIGNGLTSTPAVGARALGAAAPANVRLVCHGASAQNLCFLVAEGEATGVAARLHGEFLEGEES